MLLLYSVGDCNLSHLHPVLVYLVKSLHLPIQWIVSTSRFHPSLQSGCLSGGQNELREGRQHPQVLHHLWPAGRLWTVRCEHEPWRDHVAQQEATSVCACSLQPPAHWGAHSSHCSLNQLHRRTSTTVPLPWTSFLPLGDEDRRDSGVVSLP